MKKYIITPIFFLILLVTTFSCKKDFLEVLPKGKVIAVNFKDYDLLLNNPDLQNVGANAQLMMGSEVCCTATYFDGLTKAEQRLFTWSDQIYESDENSPETEGPLANIYTYNKIIGEVMNAPGGTEEQKKQVRAEALAGRAWTYFLLINYYGKPYQEASAAGDPGFPIITTADITVNQFSRATVQEVYDFIINDLETAIADLSPTVFHRLRMSRPAAQALLGKVYVYMQQYAKALPLLEASLQGATTAQVPLDLYDYNEAFAPGGVFLPISTFGPNYPNTSDNQEVMYLRQFSNFHVLFNTLQVTGATMSLYQPSDLRLQLYSNTPFPSGNSFPEGAQRRMAPSIVPYGVNLPEIYLLLAECKVRTQDLDGAVQTLEVLRKHRMPVAAAGVPSNIASDPAGLLQFVLDERLREFAGLGLHWFVMRRLSVDTQFKQPAYTHTLYNEDGTSTVYTLKPERFVLKLPPKILLANPGMQDNP